MKQFAMFMRFIFAFDDKANLQQKRNKKREAFSGSAKREIIWSKSQVGPSTYWKTRIIERN